MLLDLIRDTAASADDRALIVGSDDTLSWSQSAERAERIAAGLRHAGIERFGVTVPRAADVVALLAAASATGSEACVYPPDLDADGWAGLAHRFGHTTVVTDHAASIPGATAVPLRTLEAAEPDPRPSPPAGGAVPAPWLVLTTGTTGDPKGARHDWGRLVSAVRSPDKRPANRWLLAYNLNQFAGIQVLVHVLVSGATAVVPASRRAEDVATAIREHRVTHASGTPTFWRMIVGRLEAEDADGLALERITLGGEPVSDDLLARLRARFPDADIAQIYGATEFGTAISVRDGRSGLPLSVLDRDDDAPVRLRIVDGELQMRSRVGMLGYHEAGDASAAQWRPTGDLVEVRDDRIHFVGRTTEIINVGGVKVHPRPIEDLACEVDGVQLAAAYGRANAITGHAVMLDLVAEPNTDRDALPERVRIACDRLPAASRPRRIRVVDALATRGDKLVRDGGTSA